jgi:hypothetical protein
VEKQLFSNKRAPVRITIPEGGSSLTSFCYAKRIMSIIKTGRRAIVALGPRIQAFDYIEVEQYLLKFSIEIFYEGEINGRDA